MTLFRPRRAQLVLAVAVALVGLWTWQGVPSMGAPSSDLRSYPASAGGPPPSPAYLGGPFASDNPAVQQLYLTEQVTGVRLWLQPAAGANSGAALIELRGGPDGPSLRSAMVRVRAGSPAMLLALSPPLSPAEIPARGPSYLLVSGLRGGAPVLAGMNRGDRYPPGRLLIAGVEADRQDDLYFEAIVRFRPFADLPLLIRADEGGAAVIAWAPAVLVALFAALLAAAARRRPPLPAQAAWTLAATFLLALVFTLDAFDVGFFPALGLATAGRLT